MGGTRIRAGGADVMGGKDGSLGVGPEGGGDGGTG